MAAIERQSKREKSDMQNNASFALNWHMTDCLTARNANAFYLKKTG